MDLTDITPIILTYNEDPNIGRILEKLKWAKDIVIVDSYSTDETLSIARRFPKVRIYQRSFDNHASQCNFALTETDISTQWVLSLDADYVFSEEFVEELRQLEPPPHICGYQAGFRYCIEGYVLRGCLYPPRTVLFRLKKSHYFQDGHAHRIKTEGRVDSLKSLIFHDDRKPLNHWLMSQIRYAEMEAHKLMEQTLRSLSWPDKVRKIPFLAPILVVLYVLFIKGLILDGKAGLYYCAQRAVAEMLLSLCLVREPIERKGKSFRCP